MALRRGRRIGPYEVVSAVGAGGMGEVYRARDRRLGRDVALKVLSLEQAADPDRRRRFEREARALAALSHPNVVALFDAGSSDGTAYAVFELLEGETLRQRLERGPIPARKAADYAAQVCRGLAAAHAAGIVHRDLKPENLAFAADGTIKILDFGLARLAGAAGESQDGVPTMRTAVGIVMGTTDYLSPEQARGSSADARSDIFVLGAILYEMLAGRRAFEAATAADTISAVLHRDPPELATVAPEPVPAELARILRRCLEKEPEDRFQSARDLAFALEGQSGIPLPLPTSWGRERTRGGWMSGGALAIGLGAFAAAVWRTIERLPPAEGPNDGLTASCAGRAPGRRNAPSPGR
jgi:eukaryotic-like serine/threonine-protein kinase